MKATFEFNLDDPDDELKHKQMLAADNLLAALWQLDTRLRDLIKHSNSHDTETLIFVREFLNEQLRQNSIYLGVLYP